MCLQKRRVRYRHLFELDDRDVFPVLLAVDQALVVPFYGLVDHLQPPGRMLNVLKVGICQVVLRTQVLADDPLHQRLHDLAPAIVDQPQQIPRRNISFIIL